MSFKLGISIGVLLFFTLTVQSQTPVDLMVEQIIESVTENAEEDFDYSELV